MIQTQKIRELVLSVDRNGLMWVTDFRHPYLNPVMEFYSRAGDWDSWAVILGAILISKKRKVALAVLPRLFSALALCYTLKRFAKRSRPSVTVEGFSTLVSDPDPYSFPSSHSACSWAACVAAAREVGGLGWLLTFHAALISYSRIHVGAHYPMDVLVGSAVGSTIGAM